MRQFTLSAAGIALAALLSSAPAMAQAYNTDLIGWNRGGGDTAEHRITVRDVPIAARDAARDAESGCVIGQADVGWCAQVSRATPMRRCCRAL